MSHIPQIRRICFMICVGSLALGTLMLFALIWLPIRDDMLLRVFLTVLVLFISSLLAMAVMRYFPEGLWPAEASVPTPETHVMCPKCGQLVQRESKRCDHCLCSLIPQ